jgi:hypothetical protein
METAKVNRNLEEITILRWILKKESVRLGFDTNNPVEGLCEHQNEPFKFHKT